jgi:hypothetical protein
MAEDQDTRQDEDVEGHRFTSATPDEGKADQPGVKTAETGEEDDVEGHRFTNATPDEGKSDSPGVYTR